MKREIVGFGRGALSGPRPRINWRLTSRVWAST